MKFNIYPINLLKALSMALELAVGDISRHHWRTAMISNVIAKHIGMKEVERQKLIYAALLHDIGAASRCEEKNRLKMFDISKFDIHKHAEEGYILLKDSPQLGMLANSIRHHHDNWEGNNLTGLCQEEIPLGSRIINLADRVEVLLPGDVFILIRRGEILKLINNQKGKIFDPNLVDVLYEVSKRESFWLDLINPNYDNFFNALDANKFIKFNIDDMMDISKIFAKIINRTSNFTATHSNGVANIAALIASEMGYDEIEVKQIKIAGLLHDIGKLAIPNNILEKPGKLTSDEFNIIKQHTYYTYHILRQIDSFERIAEWAAYHHETLDGNGYPFRLGAKTLDLGARIVAVADVFVALSEERPYREGLKVEQVIEIMTGMVQKHKLDKIVVEKLLSIHTKARYLVIAS